MKKTKARFLSKKLLIILIPVVIVLVLATAFSFHFYEKYQRSQLLLKNPTEAARLEMKTLLNQVSKHIELPNEDPTLATVSDTKKLADQPFFQKAKNGDKVFIYSQARKAILYRPATDKIIEVSVVNLGGAIGATASNQVNNTKLAIYNGTNTVGLASTSEEQLKKKIANIEIAVKENASKSDYEKTIVVVLTKGKEQVARTVAEFLEAQVSSLPQDEVKPETDILIILGSDYVKK